MLQKHIKDKVKYIINNMEHIKTKSCKTCNQIKDVINFHKNGTTYHPSCKPCRSEDRKKIRYERPSDGLRKCACCEIEKNISEFHSDKSSPTGLQTYCKDCQCEKSKKWASTLDGFIKRLHLDMRHNAKKRAKELNIEITCDDIKELYKKQNGLCALTGRLMTTDTYMVKGNQHIINKMNISIDRINSDLGYTKDNIQLVAAIVNRMKTDLPDSEFIKICSIITEHNNKK
jgi:hypothetical protein